MDSSFRVWKDIDPDSTASDGFWNGGEPVTVTGSMGSADFGELVGSAIDDNYFYLNSKDGADYTLHIWARDSTDFYISDPDPAYSIALGSLGAGGHLFSDGEYLYVNSNSRVWYLPLATLSTTSTLTEIPDSDYWSSSVEQVASQNGHLFLSDKGYHRVLVWEDKGRAMAGEAPDVFLGATDEDDFGPNIGEKGLFWPSEMAFEANALWVGEYKFSGRAVRFSPKAP